jgi:hypothetical protein
LATCESKSHAQESSGLDIQKALFENLLLKSGYNHQYSLKKDTILTIVGIVMINLFCILPLSSTTLAQFDMPGFAQLQKGSALQNNEGMLFLALQVANTIPSARNLVDSGQFGLQYPAFGYLWINSQSNIGLVTLIMNPAFAPSSWWTYQIALTGGNTGQQLCIQNEIPTRDIVYIQNNVLQTEMVNPMPNALVPNIGASFGIFSNPNCPTGLGMSIISAVWL